MKNSYKQTRFSKESRGFTLIELLVVIAIIGILAAIILVSLSSARSKANASSIESELADMRSQAELFTGTMVGSGAACSTGGSNLWGTLNNGLSALLTGASTNLGGFTAGNSYCYSSAVLPSAGGGWGVAIQLPNNNGYWCVDYTGTSRSTNSTGAAYTSLTSATLATAAFNTTSNTCN